MKHNEKEIESLVYLCVFFCVRIQPILASFTPVQCQGRKKGIEYTKLQVSLFLTILLKFGCLSHTSMIPNKPLWHPVAWVSCGHTLNINSNVNWFSYNYVQDCIFLLFILSIKHSIIHLFVCFLACLPVFMVLNKGVIYYCF